MWFPYLFLLEGSQLVGVVWYMGYRHPTIMNWIPYDWEDDRPLDGKINNLLTVAHMF
jgi:hypothetical protein